MYEKEFAKRLAYLRMQKGVSAREMSLAIGQNSSYINRIENGKVFPSMQGFFYICEYLEITPEEFFYAADGKNRLSDAVRTLEKLSKRQLNLIMDVAEEFAGRS